MTDITITLYTDAEVAGIVGETAAGIAFVDEYTDGRSDVPRSGVQNMLNAAHEKGLIALVETQP